VTKPGPSVTSGADTQPGSDSLFPSGFGGGSLIRTGGVGTSELADGSVAAADLNLASVASAIAARSELTGAFAPKNLATVDLCSAPYNLSPGDDATTALQTALTAVGVAKTSADIYFSKPGRYTLNGAQQTGTVLGYTYSGQVLLPAVDTTHGVAIRIRGACPPHGHQYGYDNSTVLVSNATTGWVFDCIPDHTRFGAANPWTELHLMFQDIVIEGPSDPTSGGIRATTCASFAAERLVIASTLPPGTGQTKTGTSAAIALPQVQNQGRISLRDVSIRSWGYGIDLTEHAELSQVRIAFCPVGFYSKGGAHANTFSHVNVENCLTIFKMDATATATSPLVVAGTLDLDNSSDAPVAFVDQPTVGCIAGSLNLMMTNPNGGYPLKNASLSSYGLGPLDLRNIRGTGVSAGYQGGWQNRHPVDTFTRSSTTLTSGAPGLAWPSLHPWGVRAGSFQVTASGLQSTNGTSESTALVPVRNPQGESRTASMTATWAAGTTWSFGLVMNLVRGGTNEGNHLRIAAIGASGLFLYKNISGSATSVASIGALGGFGGTSHTIAARVVNDAIGRPSMVYVYVDGVQKLSWKVDATTAAALVAGSVYPYLSDGVQFFDAASAITAFSVTSAVPDPAFVKSGTATLVAGTVTVADTSITASSVIRYFRTTVGGTTGDLSLSLSAGASFTLTSTSNTETSTIYYEIVSY
jgi:hypothetical protein